MVFVYYTYNSDGIRTKKYEYNGNDMYSYTHNYVLDGSKILKETILYSSAFNGNSTTTLEYYYDESGIASFRYNGTVYHYIKNLQGDVIGIVNSNNGGIVVEYTYDAWGNVLSITGELASTVGQINPFRYRGYYYDSETGLYYLNSRYYDSQVGRFVNADGIIGANGGLQGYNMFAYCNNNPVMLIDPSGMIAYVCFKDSYNPTTMPWYNSSSTSGGGSGSKASRRGWRAPNMISQELKADIRNFNLFNDDPNVVLNSNYFSIYNGVLVVRTDLDRSGSFGALFLNSNADVETINHEYGHVWQLMFMGPVNYGLMIGLPSWREWSERLYQQRPWEVTANVFGGVPPVGDYEYSTSDVVRGFAYMGVSSAFGPLGYLFLISEYNYEENK